MNLTLRKTHVNPALLSRQRGFLLNPFRFGGGGGGGGGGGSDPLFNSVSLLLHMDGSNGSDTFTDSSSFSRSVTRRTTGAYISTAQYKFDGSSCFFESNSGLVLSTWAGLTSDFTIEFWINPSGTQSTNAAVFACNTTGGFHIEFSSGVINFYSYNFATRDNVGYTSSITSGVWTHVAITRVGTTFRVFTGGLKTSELTSSNNFGSVEVSSQYYVAYNPYFGLGFTGFIDDLRVTKGFARYTANFTPPSAPFPNAVGGIYFVAAANGGWTSDSVALPGGWSAGNIAIVSCVNVVGVNITPPAGWTVINSLSSGTARIIAAYRILQAGDTTTGTWANANNVGVSIYAGQAATPIGQVETWAAAATSQTYPAITCQVSNSTSWIISCGGKNNASVTAMGVPSGLVSRSASNCNILLDSGAPANSQALLTAGDSGTNHARASIVFELKAA